MAKALAQATILGLETKPVAGLTPAEMAVLRLVAQGMTNAQIARHLGKRPSTVKLQAASILKKLQVHSRVSAAVWYWRHHPD